MPSTAYSPQTDDRDVGLGVAFFKHRYRSTEDHKIYHDFTHLPIFGYCPGCSSKAHLNLALSNSSTEVTPDLSASAISTSESLDIANSDLPDYPEDGVLVTAETHHSGPSYSYDDQIVDAREDYRCKMVKVMLDKWANIDKLKKQREANERKIAERKEREEQALHKARMRWNVEVQRQEQMLDKAYANGLVKMVKAAEQDAMNATEASSITEKNATTADDVKAILKERKLNVEPAVFVRKANQQRQSRPPATNKPKKRGLGLGLSGYGDPEDLQGSEGDRLVAYEDSEGEEGYPIVID